MPNLVLIIILNPTLIEQIQGLAKKLLISLIIIITLIQAIKALWILIK